MKNVGKNANYKRVPDTIPWLFVNFTTLKITQMQKPTTNFFQEVGTTKKK